MQQDFAIKPGGQLHKEFKDSVVCMGFSILSANAPDKRKLATDVKTLSKAGFKEVKLLITDTLHAHDLRFKDLRNTDTKQFYLEAYNAGIEYFRENLLPILVELHNEAVQYPQMPKFNYQICFWHENAYENFQEMLSLREAIFKDGESISLETARRRLKQWSEERRKIFMTGILKEKQEFSRYKQETFAMYNESFRNDKAFYFSIEAAVRATRARISERAWRLDYAGAQVGNIEVKKEILEEERRLQNNALVDYAVEETAELWRWGATDYCDYTAYRGKLNDAMNHIIATKLQGKLAHLNLPSAFEVPRKARGRNQRQNENHLQRVRSQSPTDDSGKLELLPRQTQSAPSTPPSSSPPASPTKKSSPMPRVLNSAPIMYQHPTGSMEIATNDSTMLHALQQVQPMQQQQPLMPQMPTGGPYYHPAHPNVMPAAPVQTGYSINMQQAPYGQVFHSTMPFPDPEQMVMRRFELLQKQSAVLEEQAALLNLMEVMAYYKQQQPQNYQFLYAYTQQQHMQQQAMLSNPTVGAAPSSPSYNAATVPPQLFQNVGQQQREAPQGVVFARICSQPNLMLFNNRVVPPTVAPAITAGTPVMTPSLTGVKYN